MIIGDKVCNICQAFDPTTKECRRHAGPGTVITDPASHWCWEGIWRQWDTENLRQRLRERMDCDDLKKSNDQVDTELGRPSQKR